MLKIFTKEKRKSIKKKDFYKKNKNKKMKLTKYK